MSDFYPCVVKLGKIGTLPNSDFLEITTVMGEFPVILRKGDYQEGQLVSFVPYDAVVPCMELFHFLEPNVPVEEMSVKRRTIKAKKIRGVYSEGLIVPAPPGFNEGDSITEYFGLTKRVYEEELPEQGNSNNEAAPKTFSLFKYDLDGMAKYGYVFDEGEEVIITEKIEGENYTAIYTEDRLWIRSRNWFKKDDLDSHWWQVARQYKLDEALKNYPDLAIWCECYGAVKGWRYDCPVVDNKIQRKLRVFDIWDIKHNKFLEWDQVVEISQAIGIETVPVLYRGKWTSDRSLHALAEGKSTIGNSVREGMVVKSVPESWHPKLGRKIVKLKGRDYKLIKG